MARSKRSRSSSEESRGSSSSSRSASSSDSGGEDERSTTLTRGDRRGGNSGKDDKPAEESTHDNPEKDVRQDGSATVDNKRSDDAKPGPPAPARQVIPKGKIAAETIKGRTGGVYIPPFKLAQMKKEVKDKASEEYQRMTWEALRKSINGLINKVNVSNIKNIIPELFQENLVRGRGLFARAVMKAQLASPGFTHVYAALVAVVNTKMPEIGELILRRVVMRFRRSYKRRDKVVAIALARFIAHLVNQQVARELLALQVLVLLLENPTDDSVEVAVNFTKEVGQILSELSPQGLNSIFERFRGILHEGEIDKRVQYTIEGLFAIRKGGFKDYPAVYSELDLVEAADQISFEIGLEDELDGEEHLDIFRYDPDFEKNEEAWSLIKKEILGEESSDESSDEEGSSDEEEDEEEAAEQPQQSAIQDFTEQDLVNLRRTIYLTIMSSLSHEECAHKLMKLNLREGQEIEVCNMIIECCSQEKTYLRYYGLLGQRFCQINKRYQETFDQVFAAQYETIHRLETNKLRNVAKFFSHLLYSDALPWTVFEYIQLNEESTTSSSRIFIKILCQELSEHMGLLQLKERFNDEYMAVVFAGLFPKDNPRNTRFAINFFTSIGLGGLTDGLRQHLKDLPKLIAQQEKEQAPEESETSSSSSSDSSDSSSDDSSDSDSGSSSSGSSSESDSSDDSSSSESESESDNDGRRRRDRRRGSLSVSPKIRRGSPRGSSPTVGKEGRRASQGKRRSEERNGLPERRSRSRSTGSRREDRVKNEEGRAPRREDGRRRASRDRSRERRATPDRRHARRSEERFSDKRQKEDKEKGRSSSPAAEGRKNQKRDGPLSRNGAVKEEDTGRRDKSPRKETAKPSEGDRKQEQEKDSAGKLESSKKDERIEGEGTRKVSGSPSERKRYREDRPQGRRSTSPKRRRTRSTSRSESRGRRRARSRSRERYRERRSRSGPRYRERR